MCKRNLGGNSFFGIVLSVLVRYLNTFHASTTVIVLDFCILVPIKDPNDRSYHNCASRISFDASANLWIGSYSTLDEILYECTVNTDPQVSTIQK